MDVTADGGVDRLLNKMSRSEILSITLKRAGDKTARQETITVEADRGKRKSQ